MSGKVLLVDDHTLFIEGLKYMLETYDINVIGTAKNGLEAVKKAKTLNPDIILMDITMPNCDGLTALKEIKNKFPKIKVIMLTTSEDDETLFEAIRLGASGYLLKNLNAEELVDMLKELEKGEVPLSHGLAERLLKELRDKKYKTNENIKKTDDTKFIKDTVLTQRQIEVLELVAKGNTYREVGKVLGITERTIKYHMGRIIEILQIENKSQAIVHASKIGLVDTKKG